MQVTPASKASYSQPSPPRGSEYATLSRQVRQAGLLDRLFGSYAQALRYLNATGRLTRAAA